MHVITTSKNLIRKLELDTLSAILWFENNYMILNKTKCHFLISGNTHEHLWAKVGNEMIWESSKEKLLGINLDNNLTFKDHVSTLNMSAYKYFMIIINSRSLRRAQMGNGVHFVFFIDFVLLKGAESKTID